METRKRLANKNGNGNDFVNKTFRLKNEQVRKLESDAARAAISTNGLTTSIMQRFIEWDRYANEVNFLCLPQNM